MDKNSVIGLVLIALIMIVWMQFMAPERKPLQEMDRPVAAAVEDDMATERERAAEAGPGDMLGEFSAAAQGEEQLLTIDNELFTAVLSSHGATLKSLVLKEHLDSNRERFDLVKNTDSGALSLFFLTRGGKSIDTRDLYFRTSTPGRETSLSGDETFDVRYSLEVSPGKTIDVVYTFSGDSYRIGYDVQMNGFAGQLAGDELQVQWDGGLVHSEKNDEDELQHSWASAYMGGGLLKLDAADPSRNYREEQSGTAEWVAVRTKYFVASLIPSSATEGVYLTGERFAGQLFEDYTAALKFRVPSDENTFTESLDLYVGPISYNTVKALGVDLEKIMDFGWDWLTRPFAEYIILPIFNLLNNFIGNYGLIIIIFALLIKLVTYPLTMASTKSMKKMAALQPMLKELQEKYKDNPAKMQSELSRIYKEAGVNPLGGCLPVVIQMPLLFAMFYVFRSSIQLRQEGFLWAKDLSVPDSILDFGFSIPLYGDHIALFPILMAGAVYVQQKITPASQTNEQMKAMLYIFPAMMLLFFNNLPAGLGLYYLMFNVFSIAQTWYINKTTSTEDLPAISPAPSPAKGQKKKKNSRKR
ncbi:membrane protein insertase YidC [Prosthecochloris sp. N3]|uniref:Membrane protein insertase YidC n=1 Tax=Prosthecochloris ethylica TaxID=2743976 RepID=A0ABR9XRB7_9CHLB|nr:MULTISPECIES: membrane protein insertase YidC [Prosthecochloris]MBF0586029.1 membrane protein insertase YidC [Prosthecochloris ethylica]MBF0636571.1 membrane protein insertase YidC [Prosthecochloris ethylica]NUK47203.1 membrane protein insertase YidC [Prosthecochloris ethylica]RNA65733.1 membrane protein insertase YidC [Prosthecochloris sp. ZM_2]